jgi:hypothetical protein
MNKAIAALIAGLFAIASASALAAESTPLSKQAELNKVIAGGNANAPARGEAIKKSAAGSTEPMMLADSSTHEKMLDKAISSGNANAPARGKAIADSIHSTPRAA